MLDFFDWVYAEQTTHLAEQKAHYAEYLATFEGTEPVDERQAEPAYGGGV
jgi:hypothetical protein